MPSSKLDDAPSDIVASLLVMLGLGSNSDLNALWPVFVEDEPDAPDNVITVYTSGSFGTGRFMTDGQQQEEYGFQVRVRSQQFQEGWLKIHQISTGLDSVLLQTVTIGTNVYRVQSVNRRGGVLSLGKEYPESQRSLFTVNAQLCVRSLTS